MGRAYVLVEGHGERGAVDNLLWRLCEDLGLALTWAPAIRRPDLRSPRGVEQGAEIVRAKADAEALLVLCDEDDDCPKERAPLMAAWLERLQLHFPAAIVLLRPEYEVLFLPCLHRMEGKPLGTGAASRPGLRSGTRWEGGWESRRDVKGWLTAHFPPNRIYKPTLDQLPLTRMIDFDDLRRADLPCFGTLERAVKFLADGLPERVYPPARRS